VDATGDREDNLFPSQLSPSEGYSGFLNLEQSEQRKRWGYPICWSRDGYEWCAYLPAVCDYNYPIFQGMSRTPNIVTTEDSRYKLDDEEIKRWSNVECVMVNVAKVLAGGRLESLDSTVPCSPSQFGYQDTHSKPEHARLSARKSLNAFQRLLGYCAYSMAAAPYSPVHNPRNPTGPHTSKLMSFLERSARDFQTLAKLLLSTLSRMGTFGNYAGVVVHSNKPYNYVAVKIMAARNVPVYVAWPTSGENPYTRFHQHHHLEEFLPKPEQLRALVEPPNPVDNAPAIHRSLLEDQKPSETWDHPMDYVKQRTQELPQQLERDPQRQQKLDRLTASLTARGVGRAGFFRFDRTETGETKACWSRTLLKKAEAVSYFNDARKHELWYVPSVIFPFSFSHWPARFDCYKNEWNYSEELNIKDNKPSEGSHCHETDEMDVEESYDVGEASGVVLMALEEGEVMDDSDDPFPEEPPNSQKTYQAAFTNGVLERALHTCQFSTSPDLADNWTNIEDFLRMRYGLYSLSGDDIPGPSDDFPLSVGLPRDDHRPPGSRGDIDRSVYELFISFTNQSDPPDEFDLCQTGNNFFVRYPRITLKVQSFGEDYLITVDDNLPRLWKLLIRDPLTVIQIFREQWDLADDNLIHNLVRKGLPFKILYPSRLQSAAFRTHPGSKIHLDGTSPTPADYLVYRLEVADMFKLYPHTYAAALCSGGILWRIAVDSLPPPTTRDLVRSFDRNVCDIHTIGGVSHWSPKLTSDEQDFIVGVYMWACKLNRGRSVNSLTIDFRLQAICQAR
jgi:hypothetical protein